MNPIDLLYISHYKSYVYVFNLTSSCYMLKVPSQASLYQKLIHMDNRNHEYISSCMQGYPTGTLGPLSCVLNKSIMF
jgi:hypothetical protein